MQSTSISRKSSSTAQQARQNSQGRRCYGLWPPSIKSAAPGLSQELACGIAFTILQNSCNNFPMPSSLQSSADLCITRRVFNPPPPPGSTAHSAPPCAHSPCGRPKPPTLAFLIDFCTPQKSSKKRLPENIPQNLKSRTPDRPNVDFGITFGVHLGIDFH